MSATETAAGPEVLELPAMPATGPLYRRAAMSLLPGVGAARGAHLPALQVVVRDVAVDRAHLAAYDRVCGFRLRDTLPATYPHVMSAALSMRLMTAPGFPFPVVGLVHVGNRITVRRQIDAGERLTFTGYATDLRPHERGRQFDLVVTAAIDGEVVWDDVSTYLRRGGPAGGTDGTADGAADGTDGGAASGDRSGAAPGGDAPRDGRRGEDRPAPPAATARWRVEPAVAKAYAAVSGDHNPIHTSRIGARAFGFPRPIAHGMWSKARCLSAIEERLPEAYTVDVAFKLPILLPATVALAATPLGATPRPGGLAPGGFALHDVRSGKPHLSGSVSAEAGMTTGSTGNM
ncbi:MaoC/PaaZ C-terminal domain-containing protein [Melissospora conviva]|uniref:MaoC/PaaZ C-terminal domain-containing protein n=1 Tax=Melissospora conviva TaxID=3388432 RepID=UPI003C1E54B1